MEGEQMRDTIHSGTVHGHDDGTRPLSASVAVAATLQFRPTRSRPGVPHVIGQVSPSRNVTLSQLFPMAADWPVITSASSHVIECGTNQIGSNT